MVSQNLAVGDAIQGDTTSQAQILRPEFMACGVRKASNDFFGNCLNRARKIHLALSERTFRIAWGAAEQPGEFRPGHRQPAGIIEIVQVEAKGAVRLKVDQMGANKVNV